MMSRRRQTRSVKLGEGRSRYKSVISKQQKKNAGYHYMKNKIPTGAIPALSQERLIWPRRKIHFSSRATKNFVFDSHIIIALKES